jgi:inner membrane transporter RhtA
MTEATVPRPSDRVRPEAYFVVSALFHYLGPAFAVLLFARVEALGVAWLRIVTAAAVLALWGRPRRAWRIADRAERRLVAGWGLVLALMNACFYLAIDRLPLGTVAAVEFAGPLALAVVGTRTLRNGVALALAVAGVAVLADVSLSGSPVGFLFAVANMVLFTGYIVLAHRVSRNGILAGVDGLAMAMVVAACVALPLGAADAAAAFATPAVLLAAVGVGITSSVVPYVFDQLAMLRLDRATYAMLVALLPATATVIGIVVLAQVPAPAEVAGVALVIVAVAVHREVTA